MRLRVALTALLPALTLAACGGLGEDYRDGSYIAEAKGHHAEQAIRVEVTIAQGNITDVRVLDHRESLEKIPQTEVALENLPRAIVKKNSTAVDTVAGATETSNGIKNAVDIALNRAKK